MPCRQRVVPLLLCTQLFVLAQEGRGANCQPCCCSESPGVAYHQPQATTRGSPGSESCLRLGSCFCWHSKAKAPTTTDGAAKRNPLVPPNNCSGQQCWLAPAAGSQSCLSRQRLLLLLVDGCGEPFSLAQEAHLMICMYPAQHTIQYVLDRTTPHTEPHPHPDKSSRHFAVCLRCGRDGRTDHLLIDV